MFKKPRPLSASSRAHGKLALKRAPTSLCRASATATSELQKRCDRMRKVKIVNQARSGQTSMVAWLKGTCLFSPITMVFTVTRREVVKSERSVGVSRPSLGSSVMCPLLIRPLVPTDYVETRPSPSLALSNAPTCAERGN